MSLHTQLIRGLLALPAAVLIAVATLLAPQAPALACAMDSGVALTHVDVVAGAAQVSIARSAVASR